MARLDRGLAPHTGCSFTHTAPHHDDIMLGYLAKVGHELGEGNSEHLFSYATSGFNAVTNDYAKAALEDAAGWLEALADRGTLAKRRSLLLSILISFVVRKYVSLNVSQRGLCPRGGQPARV